MGMYDTIEFLATCPYCGANSNLSGQLKWGLLSGAKKKIGDRIVWSDPANKMWPKANYSDGGKEPPNKSVVVIGLMSGCSQCRALPKPGDFREIFIEIRDDVIVDAYLSVPIEKARSLAHEIIESKDFGVFAGDMRSKVDSLALITARLKPELMKDYLTNIIDLDYRHREEILRTIDAISANVRAHNETRAKSGRNAQIGPNYFGPALQSIGLSSVRAVLERMAGNSADTLQERAKSMLANFPETISE